MIIRKRLMIILLLVVVLSSTGIYFYTQRDSNTAELSENQQEVAPGVQLRNSRLVSREAGHRLWEIVGDQVRDDGDVVYIGELGELILYRDNQPYYYVAGNHGLWQKNHNYLELTGDLVVTRADAFRMEANRLRWDAATEVLDIYGSVVFHFEGGDNDEI